MTKKHYLFFETVSANYEHNKEPRYLCNWAVAMKMENATKKISEVDCKNCLRIIHNWEFKDK